MKKDQTTIAVLGATGMVGSRVITEGSIRGHEMLALSRKPGSGTPNATPIAVDVDDAPALRKALTAGAVDAVVVTVRTEPADEAFLVGATRGVLDIAAQLDVRVLVIGGAGALRSPGAVDLLVADNPEYVPAAYKAVAAAGLAQLRTCRSHAHTNWTYLSPPALLEPGARTARYRRGTDTLLVAADGRSWISVEDLAVAVLDELENPGPDQHITVVHRGEGGLPA
ncbi:NAD(P)H-binding protein [Streptomyces sp. SID5910]|uniref:NAD(P)-dependent oxidoreductase n=1 Tax=Streptomyces sp. SID5910 TaxID=2690312 RepID=UPI001371CD30|nr:NAD(P)H-binding protein [Streptomyces sp. SID5910]MYR40890.1 NAD(P)H-binding protein [Streptomyces sp. SID5910]